MMVHVVVRLILLAGLMISTGVTSLLVSVFDVKHYFHLQVHFFLLDAPAF